MPRIMVVDDDQEILTTTVNMIRRHGYDVDFASHGVEALQKINILKPDLILSDVLMPQMDGYKFYKELKNSAKFSDIPVLIITGHGQMEDSFQVAGVDGFITKPFTMQDLFNEIEGVLAININRKKILAPGAESLRKKIIALSPDKNILHNMKFQVDRAGYYFSGANMSNLLIAQLMVEPQDLVFVDILCQDMEIDRLIDILKRLPQLERKPIVAFSSNTALIQAQNLVSTQVIADKSISAGAAEYIGNYHPRTFLRAILNHLVNHR